MATKRVTPVKTAPATNITLTIVEDPYPAQAQQLPVQDALVQPGNRPVLDATNFDVVPLATDEHWQEYRATRNARGWNWIALSMGLAPKTEMQSKLVGAPRAEYLRRKRFVMRSATDQQGGPGRVQYETDIRLPNSTEASASYTFNRSFDVVKMVDFLRSYPDLEVDPKLIEIADHWRRVDQEVKAATAGPALKVASSTRHEKAAKTRVEKSALDLILGMAVAKYGYRPIGLVSDARGAKSQDEVLLKIEADLRRHFLTVEVGVIRTRLAEAVELLKDEERENLKTKVEAMKPRATASKR